MKQESKTETGSMNDNKEDYDLIREYAQQLNGGIEALDEDSEVTSHQSIDEYNHI
ncbi:hypothetical protein [Paenibacillus alginolyticus]|uniref:DUF4025 domain-containing protein n=1 Tax=Paenibacillus alginolyticus TaxID=59839 RepID=A0ABT4GNM6_9BACL|nr:hypothetical protein [Paenibacillus alginolyticus]MCY9697811.1 hypothetical protein [Paenibacillus alginolyticus]MEC0143712.1 hypothetical protein [Paenibacillus alginolyticus]